MVCLKNWPITLIHELEEKPVLVMEREARLFVTMFPVGSHKSLRHRRRRRVTDRAWTVYFTLMSVNFILKGLTDLR